MAFWAPKRSAPEEQGWEAFAAEFGLVAAPELSERLIEQFALGAGELTRVYRLATEIAPQLVVFEHHSVRRGPLGRVDSWHTGVVVRSDDVQAHVPLRASAKRHAVLEGLAAGRSGAERLAHPDDAAFDAAVSVYARGSDDALPLLTEQVRAILVKLLGSADEVLEGGTRAAKERIPRRGAGPAPSVAIGQRNLFLSLEGESPFPVTALGDALVDVLSLHAALVAANRLNDAAQD